MKELGVILYASTQYTLKYLPSSSPVRRETGLPKIISRSPPCQLSLSPTSDHMAILEIAHVKWRKESESGKEAQVTPSQKSKESLRRSAEENQENRAQRAQWRIR